MSYLDDVEFAENPDPRCPCVLLLDTSASMDGAPIAALNEGLRVLQADLLEDPLAQRRVEVTIITFGNGGVQVVQDFITASRFEAPTLTAGGNTPMGAAINVALDKLQERKALYNENGIPYYRPWVFMLTDGSPTDSWQQAAERIRNEEQNKALAFFAVGIANANMERLAQISVRTPLKLQGLKFSELFLWLSRSQRRVSGSNVGDQVDLPEISGWSAV
jgi:uncharacterized protein YegL